jgi:hypothetical protein
MKQIITLAEAEIEKVKQKISQLEHEKAEALRDATCSQNQIDTETVELEKLEYSLNQLLKKFPNDFPQIEKGASPLAATKTAGKPSQIITLDDLRHLISALSRKGKRVVVKEIFSDYGYDRLPEVQEKDYVGIFNALSELLQQIV